MTLKRALSSHLSLSRTSLTRSLSVSYLCTGKIHDIISRKPLMIRSVAIVSALQDLFDMCFRGKSDSILEISDLSISQRANTFCEGSPRFVL